MKILVDISTYGTIQYLCYTVVVIKMNLYKPCVVDNDRSLKKKFSYLRYVFMHGEKYWK